MLIGKTRHEPACSGCVTPLHNLKQLPVARGVEKPRPAPVHRSPGPVKASRRPKKRKGFARRVIEEAFDFVEDLID